MRCQRQLLNIHWSDHVTNMSVRESTGLTMINQYLRRQRLSIFGHIARLDPAVPANAALRLAVDTKEGRRPDPSWSRRPGRPRHNLGGSSSRRCRNPPVNAMVCWGCQRSRSGATVLDQATMMMMNKQWIPLVFFAINVSDVDKCR